MGVQVQSCSYDAMSHELCAIAYVYEKYAVELGTMALPTIASAKNEYPEFPTRAKDVEFSELPEEEQQAYLSGVEAYKSALSTAYLNGEYEWDFDSDGDVDIYDAYYILRR